MGILTSTLVHWRHVTDKLGLTPANFVIRINFSEHMSKTFLKHSQIQIFSLSEYLNN